mmetsp:Transcript_22572/g.30910  ORF Transcript_22572/g.30910 Transcript_22572/m.30910 type:complete len:130 (-) Transcript_22572:63-452(-)|eukprot:CAMPEP_0170074282 /NCGR_PEP_ID=MMETSP0019_2-20121128/11599_1 /TAXON_ID=98059 /ORGANISM="Dinobryon sp., Strain UTEXLB2267" /LENGTH=129 /DNA_ID=CAMNT_0010284455 /DNA_START=43 /DNA_END=432 /DNA_ORIENTATION=+
MPLSFKVSGAEKDQLVASMTAILLHDCGLEITAENIRSVAASTGNVVPGNISELFATYIEKAGGVEKFFGAPGAGGGGGGAAAPASSAPAAAGAAAPAAPEKPKEEEVDALDGGMDMFGGGGGGGGGDY